MRSTQPERPSRCALPGVPAVGVNFQRTGTAPQPASPWRLHGTLPGDQFHPSRTPQRPHTAPRHPGMSIPPCLVLGFRPCHHQRGGALVGPTSYSPTPLLCSPPSSQERPPVTSTESALWAPEAPCTARISNLPGCFPVSATLSAPLDRFIAPFTHRFFGFRCICTDVRRLSQALRLP